MIYDSNSWIKIFLRPFPHKASSIRYGSINNLQKCKPSGKDRDDRGVLSKIKFDPLNIEINYPGTAIQLLQSKENPTLVAAAAALSKFGSKSLENLGILFDLDIVASILPLIRHEQVFIRRFFNFFSPYTLCLYIKANAINLSKLFWFRFATKLLAEMAALPNVRNFLVQSESYIPYFTSVLLIDSDVVIHEFVTLILAEISKDFFGVSQLLSQCDNFEFLFQRIGSYDPDVKKNSIEIIYNLLRDPLGAQEIVNSKVPQFWTTVLGVDATQLYKLIIIFSGFQLHFDKWSSEATIPSNTAVDAWCYQFISSEK